MIVIREATPDDVPLLTRMRLALEGEGHADAPPGSELGESVRAWFASHVGGDGFVGWILEDRGEPVSVGGLVLVSRPPYGGNPTGIEGLVTSMYTVPDRRGQGLGGQLLRTIIRDARRRGVGRLFLYSSSGATSLYERFGFVDDVDRGRVMSLWLAEPADGRSTA